MLALEDVIVGAANADPARANQRMPGIWPRGGPLLEQQAAWVGTDKGVYELHGTRCLPLEVAPIASRGGEEGRRKRRPSDRFT